ncbi:MAG TPA: GntR family transcriptional regulator [Acidobacteriaceae bacterium]|nr:GntR family transcriptional regulator [Acidobacteriaceae bacterium]
MIGMAVNWADFVAQRGATPVYVQLADWIESQIKTGGIEPGDQLPNQREMRDLTGHSMETAGKAVALLRERGLVETSTIGTFVRRKI